MPPASSFKQDSTVTYQSPVDRAAFRPMPYVEGDPRWRNEWDYHAYCTCFALLKVYDETKVIEVALLDGAPEAWARLLATLLTEFGIPSLSLRPVQVMADKAHQPRDILPRFHRTPSCSLRSPTMAPKLLVISDSL